MLDILTVIVIFSFCLLVSYWENRHYNTILTPFNVMAYPYAITVAMVNLIAKNYGFFNISFKSVLLFITCLSFFKLGELCLEKITNIQKNDQKIVAFRRDELDYLFAKYKNLFIVLSIISIVACSIHFFNALNQVGGWIFIASKEFEDAYGKGILSHIGQLNKPAFMFLFGYYFYSKKKYLLILLFLMFVSILLLQIKTHIITTLISGIIFSYYIKVLNINLKKLAFYGVLIFGLFNISYMIGYSKVGLADSFSSDVQIALANHFFTYLFGGTIGLSEILNYSSYPVYSPSEIFAVPINMYNKFYNDRQIIDVIIYNWIPVSTHYKYFHSTNVFNLFGVLYMYLGLLGTFIYAFFLGTISHMIKKSAIKEGAFIGTQMLYVYFLSFLTLAFFNIFFNQLQIYEGGLFMVILPAIYSNIQKIFSYLKMNAYQ